jgi:iron complex outermembrane recepter protein
LQEDLLHSNVNALECSCSQLGSIMKKAFVRKAAGLAFSVCTSAVTAQVTLKQVTVTGNPLGATDVVAPAAQLSGTDLLLRSQSTLGETLTSLPGISSTYFGPNASRPVIRGMDGDRIRLLQNGGSALDLSNLSNDHAVAADPISVERIEVLRGPAALLYGGNAIGGAVNLIDNRIPREAAPGVLGKADVGYATGGRERSGAILVEGGTERFGLHADAFARQQGEASVPLQLSCTQSGVTRIQNRICNSAASSSGGALGGSMFFDRGYLGMSATSYGSTYGAVAEDEVTIDMKTDRYALEGEVRVGGVLQSIKGRLGRTKYRHTELDAGIPGTEFRTRGTDMRLEARHAKMGEVEGVVGLQVDNTQFSADGTEAFAPYSRSQQAGMFLYEELPLAWGKLNFGARAERVRVASLGNPLLARFAPGSRSLNPVSSSVSALWNLAPDWQLTGSVAQSERAPKDYELYANGPHVATGAYELGNAAMAKERSNHLEAGLQWKRGRNLVRIDAYNSRFSNYIALLPTGSARDSAGNSGVRDCGDGTSLESGCSARVMPEMGYRGVRATFRGLELTGTSRVWDSAGGAVDIKLRADAVRAVNSTQGEPLPRIAPARIGATALWTRGVWSSQVGFDHYTRQDRVPIGDRPTSAYTLWHVAATYRVESSGATLQWYARLDNASDTLAYSATSVLTQTLPGRVPLPGRGIKVGLRANF